MKVEYAKRAVADLHKISADSRAFGEMVAAAVEARIREIIAYIREHPGRPAARKGAAGRARSVARPLSLQHFLSHSR